MISAPGRSLPTHQRFSQTQPNITHRDVQRQLGPNDCGLFVLAFLYALVDLSFDGNGKDPSFLRFEQRKMRSHYAYCSENYIFTEFPSDEMFRHKKVGSVYAYDSKSKKNRFRKQKFLLNCKLFLRVLLKKTLRVLLSNVTLSIVFAGTSR